jgi:hypothetical protein
MITMEQSLVTVRNERDEKVAQLEAITNQLADVEKKSADAIKKVCCYYSSLDMFNLSWPIMKLHIWKQLKRNVQLQHIYAKNC